ncbi:MAG: hypothetical protein RSE51_06215 [Bacteroidales bacterium]
MIKMKNISKIIIGLLCVLFVNSCDKVEYMADTKVVNVAKMTLSSTSDRSIEGEDFQGEFTVELYYPQDVPQDGRLVMVKNKKVAEAKVLISDIKSYPVQVVLTYAQITEAFGKIELGDRIEVGLDVMHDGKWYNAFNALGTSTVGPNLEGLTGMMPTVSFTKVCPLVMDDFNRKVMVSDEFWEEEYEAELVKISDTELELRGMFAGDADPIRIVVDPGTRVVTVAKQQLLATYGPYSNLAVQGKGELDACNGTITFNGTFSVSIGTFSGSFKIEIK